MMAVLQAFDADLAAFGLDALRRGFVDGDEGRVVDAGLDQILGELGADARRGAVGLDLVLDHAETLAGLEVLVFRADGSRVHQREARFIGLERGPEEVAAVEVRLAIDRQRIRAGGGGAQQQIGIVGGRALRRSAARRFPGC